jgi:hypothetical protein
MNKNVSVNAGAAVNLIRGFIDSHNVPAEVAFSKSGKVYMMFEDGERISQSKIVTALRKFSVDASDDVLLCNIGNLLK